MKESHLLYRNVVTKTERPLLERKLRFTVAATKGEYWKNQVEAVKSSSGVCKLMGWRNLKKTETPPPLYNFHLILDPAERACISRDSLLARHQATDDLSPGLLIENPGSREKRG